jgi:hypothetical protein
MSWMRVLGRGLSLVAVNGVVFCVVAEALAALVFYYQHGWLFYLDPHRPTFSTPADTRDPARLTPIGLHPYFGPIHRPGIPFDIPPELRELGATMPPVVTNNVGFASPYDYPYAKQRPDEYIVGIFGGSVAGWFCHLGTERLTQRLHERPALRGTRIVPLCFSHEGYKQPQQLLVLAYFLSLGQAFDLVVNIDGFNEVALSPINEARGIDVSMPSTAHMEPLINVINQATLTPEKLDALGTITRARARLTALAPRLNATRFASVFLVLEQLHASTERRYAAERLRFGELPSSPPSSSPVHVTPPMATRHGEALFEHVAASWATASTLMHALLEARGIPYVHVLQANQYFTSRRFGPDEARVALAESAFKTSVEQGYPALVRALRSPVFARAGVNVVDGTTLFDNEPAAVYVDDCCHYTPRGNHLLADLVARAVPDAALAPH